MVDFYRLKQQCLNKIEQTIKECTEKNVACLENKLYAEASREFGFTTMVKKRIDFLVSQGTVLRKYLETGETFLVWADLWAGREENEVLSRTD